MEVQMQYSKIILITGLIFWAGCSININTGNLEVVPQEEKIIAQVPKPQDYQDYWKAIRHFDFDYIHRNEFTAEQRDFVSSLQLMIDGRSDSSVQIFEELMENTSDSLLRASCGNILKWQYIYAYRWDRLVEMNSQLPGGLDQDNSIEFVKAFQQAPAEVYHYPDQPCIIPTELSISGSPIIEVAINGHKQHFWIDTGAELTVISSSIAETCGIEPLHEEDTMVGTSTNINVGTRPAVIRELKIGDLIVENHPAWIIDKKDLEIKLFKIIKIVKIDGIIGWNLIRNLHLEIDYKNLTTTIQKPEPAEVAEGNFHFVCVPFVSMTDTLGNPFNFFLDTGAGTTYLYQPGIIKIDVSDAKASRAIIGGAGGTQRIKQSVIPNEAFILDNYRINFKTIDGHGDGENYFFYFDGCVGSDLFKNGTLIMDPLNGRCELKMNGN
jgi:predicted aspartyl protease